MDSLLRAILINRDDIDLDKEEQEQKEQQAKNEASQDIDGL